MSSSVNENNTVQKVSVANPEDGNWSVIVQGADINSVGNFSLAYTSATSVKADGLSCSYAYECASGYCVHSICRSASTYCGDDYCDTGETTSNCDDDCESGGGGGAVTEYETFFLTAEPGELEAFELNRGERIEFDLGNESHTIRLSGITNDEREFTITSEPIKVILEEGETAKLDLNNNNISDFSIILLEAIPDGAKIRVGLLQEVPKTAAPTPAEVVENKTEEVPAVQEGTTAGEEKGKQDEILLIGVSILLAITVYFMFGKKKKHGKKLGRRKKLWMSEYDDE
jgi:hypothetical protein